MGSLVDFYGGDDLDPTIHEVPGRPSVTKHSVATRTITDRDIRCQGQVPSRAEPGTTHTCNRLLAELAGRPWRLTCPRCKAVNRSPDVPDPRD